MKGPYGYGFPTGFERVDVPVGVVLPYAGPINSCTLRKLVQRGWLFCDGSVVTVAQYPELHAVIGRLYGAPATPAGAFRLPDYCGAFLRGVSFGATRCDGSPRDAEAGCRTAAGCGDGGNAGDSVGSVQEDAFQGHEHDYVKVTQGGTPNQSGTSLASPSLPEPTTGIHPMKGSSSCNASYGTPRLSAETRPLNVYVHFIVKARSHVAPQRDVGLWCPDTRDDPNAAPLT